jgi:hypothetical protein
MTPIASESETRQSGFRPKQTNCSRNLAKLWSIEDVETKCRFVEESPPCGSPFVLVAAAR